MAKELEKTVDKVQGVWIWDCTPAVRIEESKGKRTQYKVRNIDHIKS